MNKTKGIRNFLSFFTFLFSISPFIILVFFRKLFNLILPKQLGNFRFIICIILYFMLSWYITTKMFIPTIIEVIGPILLIIGIFLMILVPKKEFLLARAAFLSGLMLIILIPIILSLNFFTIGETYEDVARVGASHFFRDFMTHRGTKDFGLHVEGIGGAPDFLSNKKENNLKRGQYIRVELQNGLLGIPLLIDHDTVPLSLEEVNEIRARSKATNNSSI